MESVRGGTCSSSMRACGSSAVIMGGVARGGVDGGSWVVMLCSERGEGDQNAGAMDAEFRVESEGRQPFRGDA